MSDSASEMTLTTTWRDVEGYPMDTYNFDMVHTMETGVLKQVSFSELLSPHIVGYYPDMMPGEQVEPFLSADKKIGVLMLRFDSVEQRNAMLKEIEDHILVELE